MMIAHMNPKRLRWLALLPLLAMTTGQFAAVAQEKALTPSPAPAPTPTPTGGAQPVPPGYPPAVCAPAPTSAGPTPRHGTNAVPYRPFPATWQRTIDALVANGSIPGAVIIVKSPDWGVRVGVTGKANLVSGEKMAPDLQFRVGSVSKAFLAQAILRLEQEGKIKLSDPVLTYLAGNKLVEGIPNIDKITVANLLQMSSGVTNYLEDTGIGFSPQITPDKHFDANDIIAPLSKNGGTPKTLTPDFAPGDTYPNPYWVSLFNSAPPAPPQYPAWTYSNSNYILLGMIGEKVTGLPPQAFLQRYVFDVAGLKDTYFATDDKKLPTIHGYTKWGSIPYPVQVFNDWCDVTKINPTYAWTAGAIVSTPWDLLKFEDAMFRTDTLLNQGTKNKWFTFVSSDIHAGWEVMQYGVGGLMQPERSYGTARGHGGAFPGYKTLLYYFYDQKTSFVLSSNTWDSEWEVTMLDEIMPQVSSAATTPWPANETTGVGVAKGGSLHVGWQAGRVYGDSYDVYWGTDPAAVDRASADSHPGVQRATVTRLAADIKVKPNTTYYWRVDTVKPGYHWPKKPEEPEGIAMPLIIGPTWQFRTR